MAISLGLPPGAVPERGGFPLAWMWSWLRQTPAFAAGLIGGLPQQAMGDSDRASRRVPTEATDHNGLSDGPPAQPRAIKPFVTPDRLGTFDPATSVRLAEESTATSDAFRNADGSFARKVYQDPVNFRNGNGSWQRIDRSLRRNGNGRVGQAAADTDFTLGRDGADPDLVTMRLDAQHAYSYGLSGAAAVSPGLEGNAATYPEVLPGVDLKLEVVGNGVKESLILHSAQVPASFDFPLKLQGLSASLAPNGSLLLRDGGGDVRASVPAGFMTDARFDRARGDFTRSDSVRYELLDGGTTLRVTPDRAWLTDPARAFPVILDPSSFKETGDTYVYKTSNSDHSAENNLPVGTYDGGTHVARSLMHFTGFTSTFAGATISGAYLWAWLSWTYNCTAKKVVVKPITSSWDVSTIDWPGPSLGAEMGSATPSPGPACSNDEGNRSVGTGVTFPLQTAPIQAWLTGTANNGLALVAPSETDSTQWKRFTSRNYANYAYSPYLILIYTGPGTPQIDGAYPPTGYNSASLTPVLIAQAHDPDHSGSPFTYQFQVYDDASTVIADSGRIASSSWQVPAGKLHKGESYSWAVVASDGATSSPPSVYSLSTLPVQPPVTSRLAENGVKGFEPGAGNYTTSATDVRVRTVGPPLDNRRTYNSFDTRRTLAFGTGWSSLADMRVSELDVDPTSHAPQTLSVVYSNGREAVFGRQGDNSWAPPQGSAAKLSCLNTSSSVITCPATVSSPVFGYRLQDRDGITYDFTQASAGTYGVTSLADTAGRKQTLAYNPGTLQISKITSASGRALSFGWIGGHVQTVSTDPATPGDSTTISTWTYTYTGDLLTKVCPPGDSVHCTGYAYAAASTGYPSLVENLGPTSNWRLNDAAGSAAASSNALEQGGADNGVPSPSVAFGQPGPLAGTPSTAASFNGTDSSIALPQNLVSESGYRSVSLWFKTTASGRVILGQSNQPITNPITNPITDPIPNAITNRNYTPTLYVDTNGKLVGQFPTAPSVSNLGSLLAAETGLCVDVQGPVATAGTKVHLWSCYNTSSQQWAWNSNGTIGTTIAGNFRCLDAVDGIPNRGVVSNPCDATNLNQKWRMDPNGNIVVASTGRCLVVIPGATQGSAVMVHSCVNPVSPQQVWTQSLHTPIVSTGAAVSDGQWHHAVLAASGNSQTLYQDGVAVGTKSGLVVAGNQKYQYLGAGFTGGNWPGLPGATALTNQGRPSFFSGSIGEVAFFDRPLVAAQVSALKSARDNASRPLATITRPSGNIAAEVRYDSLTGAVSQVTDENGGVWKVDAPVVEGSYLVHSSAVLGSSPIDYWRMSETGVSDAVNELDGGTAVYQGNILLGSSEGPFGGATWAASFDGTGGYLQMPPEDAPGAGPMSVALWFRAPSGKTGTLFGYQDQPIGTAPTTWTPALYVGTDGRLRGKFWNGNFSSVLASVNRVDDGQWHHALLSASTNSQMLYLDGTAVSASPLTGTVSSPGGTFVQVGAGPSTSWPSAQASSTGYFTGDIAEVSLYRKQLSAAVANAQAGSRDKATGTALTKRYAITDPSGGKLTQQRFELPSGRLVESVDANGQRTRMGYDGLTGLLATQTDPNGNYVQFVHDKQGNITEQTSCQKRSSDPSAAVCATVYYTYYFNASNPLDPCNGKTLTSRDGRSSGPTDNTYLISYTYDSRCNLISVTDPIGRVSRTGYSLPSGTEAFDGGRIPAGLPIRVLTPGGGEQTISYYKNGDIGSIRDANGKLTTFAYDALGRVLRQNEQSDTYPTLYTDFTYDKQSRVVTQTMPRILNRVTGAYHRARSTFEYDFDGRNTKQTVTDLEGGDAPRIVSATFDSHGNLYQATDAAGQTTTYAYNGLGQPTLVTNASGVAVATTYDPVGRELTSTLKGWTGDPNSPSAPTDLVISTIDYDPAGRVANTVDAMGWVTGFDYYDDGTLWRKWRKESRDAGARAYLMEENFYDLAGNLIKQITGNGSLVTTYQVDAASRQTGSVSDPGGLNRVVSSTFDDDDNPLSITSSDAAGTVFDVNRWSYDPMGNMLSHTVYNGPSGANPANAGTARWLNTATFAADALGSNTLTATGTVGSSAADHSPTAPAGASFDGTAYFSSATSAVDTRSSFTVSAWAKVNSTSIPVTIASQDGTAVAGFTLFYNKAIDKWQFTMAREDSRAAGYESVVSSAAATEGAWTHLAGVYDARAKTMKIYVNGTLAGTQKRVALPWGAAGKLIIGANKQGADLTARPDILVRDGAGAMSYYRNSGGDVATNSIPGSTVPVGTSSNVPTALGDINGDGLADLLRCDSTGLLLQLNDSGTFSSTVTNLLSPCPYDMIGAGDVDGDGRADVVARATSGGNLVYHHNAGGNQLAPAITIRAGSAYNWLAMGDLDGDGRCDLILRNTNTNLYFARSNGDGTFAADFLFGTSWSNYSVTAGDYTGDGTVDIIAKGNAGANVPGLFIYPNHLVDGLPNLLQESRIQVGTSTWSSVVFLAAGNLNGDGEANMRGLVNDVQLYPRALTDTEIATVKASTLSPAGVFGEQTRYTLDKRGFVVAQADPLGNVWSYQNDEAGRQVVTTAPPVATMTDGVLTTLPPVSTIGYDTFGSATETRDPTGKVTVTEYDAAGRAAAQSLPAYTPPGSSTPLTPRISRTLTPTGQVNTETDAMGNLTSYTYDQMGRVARVTLPNLKTVTSTYNLLGDVLSVTDPTGARSASTYDFLGRKCTATEIVRQPTAATYTTNFGYGPSETACTAPIVTGDPMRQSLVDSPSHFKTHQSFNKRGETITSTDPAGNVTRYQYDGAGRLSRTTLPDNTYVKPTYSLAGQVTATAAYTAADAVVASVSQTYDKAGRVVSSTDALGTTSSYTFDATGMLQQASQPTGTGTITDRYWYDPAGRQTRFMNGLNNSFDTRYNVWGLVEANIEPPTTAHPAAADRTFTVAYDKNGRVTSEINPGNVTVTNTYDSVGNLKTQHGVAGSVITDRTFSYDDAGRMTQFSAPGGTNTVAYDDRGLPLSVTGPSGNSSFTWGAEGQMLTRVDAAGSTGYAYDTAGRLKTLTNGTVKLDYTYTSLNQVQSIVHGNGDTRWFTYHAGNHRLVADELKTAAGASVGRIVYDWDANGNEISKTTTGFGGPTVSNTYLYDLADRIASWSDGVHSTAYTYDAAGNRTGAGNTTFAYDARNRLLSSSAGGGTSFTYTARGTLSGTVVGTVTTPTTTDAFDQVTGQGGQTYSYDALGRSVRSGHSFSGTGNDLAADTTAQYIRTPQGDLAAVADATGGNKLYAWTDLHSDVVAQFGATDTALSRTATYDPFGKNIGTPTLMGSLGFQSEWTDASTGRVNMAARWYNPDTGQFDTRDSIEDPGNPNRYSYVANNPLSNEDPSGHMRMPEERGTPVTVKPKKPVGPVCHGSEHQGGCGSSTDHDKPPVQCHGGENRPDCGYVHRKPDPVKKTCQRVMGDHTGCMLDPPKQVLCPTASGAKVFEHCTTLRETKDYCEINGAVIPKDQLPAQARNCEEYARIMDLRGGQYEGYEDGSERDHVTAFLIGEVIQDTALKGIEKAEAEKKAKCQASFWCRNASTIGTIAGAVAGVIVGAVCLAVTAGAGSVGCAFAAGFVGGFVGSLTTGALQGKSGAELWGGALVDGLIGGVIGVLTLGLGAGLGAGVRALVSRVGSKAAGQAVTSAARQAATRAASTAAGKAVNTTLTAARNTAIKIENKVGKGLACTGLQIVTEVAQEAVALHSFDPATKVLLAGGVAVAIAEVKLGDKVLATDPRTGQTSEQPVTVLHKNVDRDLTDITVSSGSSSTVLHTTQHHPMWDATTDSWVIAAGLKAGVSTLTAPDGTVQLVTAVRNFHGRKEMRDLTVANVHTYHVVANDRPVLVHNTCEDGGGGSDIVPANSRALQAHDAADLKDLLERSKAGDLAARQEIARRTGSEYVAPAQTRAYTTTANAAQEDDLMEPGSRSPFQPPRTRVSDMGKKGKKGRIMAALIRIFDPIMPPWG